MRARAHLNILFFYYNSFKDFFVLKIYDAWKNISLRHCEFKILKNFLSDLNFVSSPHVRILEFTNSGRKEPNELDSKRTEPSSDSGVIHSCNALALYCVVCAAVLLEGVHHFALS